MARFIALVEDDPDQRENCVDALQKRGYRVEAYADRASALTGIAQRPPDLTILDVILGDEVDGGFDLCRELLVRSPGHPVIFLTERIDEVDQVAGLRLGAHDYLPKPLSLCVLAEKVATLLRLADHREAPPTRKRVVRVGDLTLDEDRGKVSWRGEPLTFTLTEYRILAHLVRRPGMVATYPELMESAQQGIVTRNTMNTHILRVRKKFKAVDSEFDRIANEHALGYRWLDE